MQRLIAYIRLTRPANILTAVADIMLGFAVTGLAFNFIHLNALIGLVISTIGLYGGGVVFNDVFDAELDKKERPERPIPSGMTSLRGAKLLGTVLMSTAIIAAYQVSIISAAIAVGIALLALLYNKFYKHHPVWGPLNMGACRCGNLFLGISVVPLAILQYWYLGLIPILYIVAITLISRGEVHGMNKKSIEIGLQLYLVMLLGILNLALMEEFQLLYALPFMLLFLALTLPPWLAALRSGKAYHIKKAVKSGILSLILLDAALAAGFTNVGYGLLILLLLPLSLLLSKTFAVT